MNVISKSLLLCISFLSLSCGVNIFYISFPPSPVVFLSNPPLCWPPTSTLRPILYLLPYISLPSSLFLCISLLFLCGLTTESFFRSSTNIFLTPLIHSFLILFIFVTRHICWSIFIIATSTFLFHFFHYPCCSSIPHYWSSYHLMHTPFPWLSC